MSNAIEDRLKDLRVNLSMAQLNPDDNKLYIEDLKLSIKLCERAVPKAKDKGYV